MPSRSLNLATLSCCLPLALLASAGNANDPSCAPGGNFDLTPWSLQLPTGSPGKVDTISSEELQGCDGYTGETFYTDESTGDMVLLAPGNPDITGCVTTPGSQHCRTELREVVPGTGEQASWDPSGTNVLRVGMRVVRADDGGHGTAIGQVFAAEASKPIAEMYFSREGEIVVGVKPDAESGQEITSVGWVEVGSSFDYEMSYSAGVLSVTINGAETELDTYSWESPACYFKAGNYNQGESGDESEVHISAVEVIHEG